MNKTEAIAIAGTLSEPSKLPCHSYGLPAEECRTGSKLVNVENSTCANCYALKGTYAMFAKRIKPAQYKRLASIENPQWCEAMITLITLSKNTWFRWHDSGDIQSIGHLEKIASIADALPHVKFWLPTREYSIVKSFLAKRTVPKNLVIRLSAHMIDGPVPDIAGLLVSSVHTENVPRGARACIAPKQNNACGDCRACWNSKVKHVSYHVH